MLRNIMFKAVQLVILAGIIAVQVLGITEIREDERDYYANKNIAMAFVHTDDGIDNNAGRIDGGIDSEIRSGFEASGGAAAAMPSEQLHIDYDLLRKANAEAIGWIYIKDTYVSYPVMQTFDNSYYLSRNMFGEKSGTGAVFADCEVDCASSDIVILYGHNMTRSGKEEMFSLLRNYEDEEYMLSNSEIITSFYESGETQWQVFASLHINLQSPAVELYKKTDFTGSEQYYAYIDLLRREATVMTGEAPEFGTRLLMLSTCIGDGNNNMRRVVFAYEKHE